MNILLITQEDYLAGSTYSVSYLAKGLASRGHRVFVAARAASLLESLLENSGARFVQFKIPSRFSLSAIHRLGRFIIDNEIDVVNAQSSKDRYVAMFARWWFRLQVAVVHTRRQYPRSDGGFLQRVLYVVGTSKIIVISEELKRIFISKGYPAAHLHVIHNGIPEDKYKKWSSDQVKALRQLHGLSETDKVIGCVSRLKKQEQIIRSLLLLNNPEVKVVLVGVTPGCFDKLVAELQIKNPIIYAGFVSGDEVLNYYHLFTCNILASITDGFGLVLLEAMAMDCPVIATNFGGIKDVVRHGWNGLLFNDNDLPALASQISLILESRVTRDKLIANGRETAYREFAMSKTVDQYESFFAQTASSGRLQSESVTLSAS